MVRLWGEEIERRELLRRIGSLEQVASVRLVTLGDGVERGVRVLEFRTGTGFAFDVIVDRAFDIGHCELNGQAIGWESGAGYGGPWFAEQEGIGWLRNWGGGLLTTCGIDHALGAAVDSADADHYPGKTTQSYGQHGRISNRPAILTGYGHRWDGDECVLYAEGEVHQAAVFGEHLVLKRRIEAKVGESRFTVHDEIVNVGWNPVSHMLLYHVNIGFPVVDAGAELLVATRSVTPVGDRPIEGYRNLEAPEPAHVERVYLHDIIAEADGTVPVGIVNRARGIGAYELFSNKQLPFHFVWRMLGEGTYVVGIEPCTNRPAGRLDAKERGELIYLQPGEAQTYDLEIGALSGTGEIEAFASRVSALGGI
jgi:hypothetical protein